MDHLDSLSSWYSAQCNGDWEHSYGINIDTLDNPGWSIRIDLAGTQLEGRPFESVSRGDSETDRNWIHCSVEGNQFIASGGIPNIAEIIGVFLMWSASAA